MKEFQATGVLIALFALRCIVPLVVTLALGYLMNRLVDRWEAEDAQPTANATTQPVPEPVVAPETTSGMKLPCWLVKGCSPTQRANCPTFQQKETSCWLARLRLEGTLPSDCPDCPIYRQAHA